MDLHSAAATIEQVLELAHRQARRRRRTVTEIEAERLADKAALEQVDHLLMDYWDQLDDIAAGRAVGGGEAEGEHVWQLASGLRVAQTPSEALRRVARLASQDLAETAEPSASDEQAVRWVHEYQRRNAAVLDRLLAR